MNSCPICGKPASPDYRPFCSRRCADVDLGRWLTEGYRIPAENEDEAEDAPADDPAPKAH
ncbi:MAG: DNA gyrase inhibitor YacG [Rhodobacterales bacterium]|nr:DNA gyrase inhibitor YacG [Rhodobacterales bacterium]